VTTEWRFAAPGAPPLEGAEEPDPCLYCIQ
jgi:hypothetical protein